MWVTPASSWALTQPLAHTPPVEREVKKRSSTSKKICCLRQKFNSWSEAKLQSSSKAKWEINSLFLIDGQMFSHFWTVGPSACVMLAWEGKRHNHEGLPSFSFPSAFIVEHDMIWNIPLVSRSHLAWLCPLPASCPPQPTWWWWGAEWEGKMKTWTLCQHCTIAKILMCYDRY